MIERHPAPRAAPDGREYPLAGSGLATASGAAARSRGALALAVAALFATSVAGGALGAALWQAHAGVPASPAPLPVRAAAAVPSLPAQASEAAPASALQVPIPPLGAPNYRGIVERFGPSVVGITVSGTPPAGGPEAGLPPFLRGLPGLAPRGEAPFRG